MNSEVFKVLWGVTGSYGRPAGERLVPRVCSGICQTFYEQSNSPEGIGFIPRVYHGIVENGGIPQLTDWDDHEAEARADVARVMAKLPADSPIQLDIESLPDWPALPFTVPALRVRSIEHADGDVKKAEAQYTEARQRLHVETIRIIREVRPRAPVGMWGAPWRHRLSPGDLSWLYPEFSAFFPMFYSDQEIETIEWHIPAARRIAGVRPVYAVLEVDGFLSHDPSTIVALARRCRAAGAHGVVLWGAAFAPEHERWVSSLAQWMSDNRAVWAAVRNGR